MYKLIHFECENFIGLYNGLGRKHVELDLRDHTDKNIFIVSGGNAQGKTTLLSILHPFSGTTDKRDTFIRQGKEGYKQLIYETDDGTQIKIKHVYVPNKAGSHATKSFIFKRTGDEELDLNPNGNVSSFLLAIEQEFGISLDFLRLSTQNEDMVGLVQMTGASRKDHIYKFIPKEDDSLVYQKIVAKKFRDIKIYLQSIVDKLGKMDDEVYIKEKLTDIEEKTNFLVEKRDKSIGKLNKYEAELKSIDPNDELMDKYKKIKSSLKELENSQEKNLMKYNKAIQYDENYSNITVPEIDNIILKLTNDRSALREDVVTLQTTISSKKANKIQLHESIIDKERVLKQFSGTKEKKDIKELLESYRDRLSEFDSRTKSLNTDITSEDLIEGINLIAYLREFLHDIYNNCSDDKILKDACENIFSNKFINRYESAREKLESIKEKRSNLSLSIDKLYSYEHLKDTISKRPHDCVIDTCEFLQDYKKWTAIDKQIKIFEENLNGIEKEYEDLFNELEYLTQVQTIKGKVEAAVTFYKNSYNLIKKLPFNDKYSNQDKFIKRILDYNLLPDAESKFYDMIEILQDKKEIDEIRNVKIPILVNELESLNKNQDLIKSIESDLQSIKDRFDKEVESISKKEKELSSIELSFLNISDEIESVENIKTLLISIEGTKKEIIDLSDSFDKIKEKSERMEVLYVKIKERKEKLKLIEAKLRPLTQERDKYKYQEIKIQEYKLEKEVLEENLSIITLIRDALSTNKGMAVSILNMYVDEIRRNANMLLSETFDGSLYLEQFLITEKEFTIPYQSNGDGGSDISMASKSERAFISSCLSMALIEQIIAQYGVLTLDEVDAGFSEQNKAIYCSILMKQMKRIGINQTFMITHSVNYYEPYDVCYIIFPGSTMKTTGKDIIDMRS